jgi:hypothetical protein
VKRIAISVVAAVAMTALLPALAEAKTVVVGSPLEGDFTAAERLIAGTVANLNLADPSANPIAPIAGAIVEVRIATVGNESGPYRIRVLRPSGDGATYAAVASGPSVLATGPRMIDPSWPRIPIRKGDTVGLDLDAGVRIGVLKAQAGSASASWNPFLAAGSPRPYSNLVQDQEYGFNATVLPPPAITSVTPSSGPFVGGERIRIRGTDLSYVRTARIGGVPLSSVHRRSERMIEATVPFSPRLGPRRIVVETYAGKARSLYRYVGATRP